MEITSDGIGMMVIVLGGLFVVSGIILMVVLSREGTWWGDILKGALSTELPDFGQGGLIPMTQNIVQGLLERIFIYVKICALVVGSGVSVLGVVLIVIGIYIMS